MPITTSATTRIASTMSQNRVCFRIASVLPKTLFRVTECDFTVVQAYRAKALSFGTAVGGIRCPVDVPAYAERSIFAMSARSLKIPYAVWATPGFSSTIPTAPIRSVSRRSRLEAPCTLARISVSLRISGRTHSRVALARAIRRMVLRCAFNAVSFCGVSLAIPRRSTSCGVSSALKKTLASAAVLAAASQPSMS